MRKSSLHDIANIVLYVILFLLIQLAVTFAVAIIAMWIGGTPWSSISQHLQTGSLGLNGKELVAATAISSVLTFCLFVACHWAPVKRNWLATRPWTALIWVVLLALGTILPSQWLVERMEITLPESAEKLFESIMGEPLGYVAIGILAPLVEELVFRGRLPRCHTPHAAEALRPQMALGAHRHLGAYLRCRTHECPTVCPRRTHWLAVRLDVLSHRLHRSGCGFPLGQQHGSLCHVPHDAADERRQTHRSLPRQPYHDDAQPALLALHLPARSIPAQHQTKESQIREPKPYPSPPRGEGMAIP